MYVPAKPCHSNAVHGPILFSWALRLSHQWLWVSRFQTKLIQLQDMFGNQYHAKQEHHNPPHMIKQTHMEDDASRNKRKNYTTPVHMLSIKPEITKRDNPTPSDALSIELLRNLSKDFPHYKDWFTFDGAGEKNHHHHEFTDWVDQLKEENMMTNILITSKLSLVVSGWK